MHDNTGKYTRQEPLGAFMMLVTSLTVAFLAPFFLFIFILETIPAPMGEILFAALTLVVWPMCLCWFYSHKLFSQGRTSIVFWLYLLLYIGMGALLVKFNISGTPDAENVGVSNFDLMIERFGGFLFPLVAILMFSWSRREKKRYLQAVKDGIAEEREDQINIHAEAILRAEEMKKQQGL